VAPASPDVTLAALRTRKGAQFIYEYDLNIPWRHEVRIEDRLPPVARKTYPVCTGGDGACPPEDRGSPESFMARRDRQIASNSTEIAPLCSRYVSLCEPGGRFVSSGRS
jgi:hypothetical protein